MGKARAYSDPKTEYYELTTSLGRLSKGAIFYYDPKDDVRGSISAGCLKLAWTPEGNCYSGLCADTVIFHADFRWSEIFRRVIPPTTKEAKLAAIIADCVMRVRVLG